MSSFPMHATALDSFLFVRNFLTKILFMKFCWIHYAKKIDSTALSLDPAFMSTWQLQVFGVEIDLDTGEPTKTKVQHS